MRVSQQRVLNCSMEKRSVNGTIDRLLVFASCAKHHTCQQGGCSDFMHEGKKEKQIFRIKTGSGCDGLRRWVGGLRVGE